jgi:lipopolysaccharide/colanic/teichoic acid biosynthesis glycosyltransferase
MKQISPYIIGKTILDYVGAFILLILFSPICLVAVILIKLDSEGPVFADTPSRVGKKGILFKMYKFRSMVQNAHDMLRNDPKYKQLFREYQNQSYKLKNDPRITRVGKFIRKHSIDEIPQLLNVLKGEMSLVGPRAYYEDELKNQQQKYPHTKRLVAEVLSIKPGITGAWQVSGRSEVNFDKRIAIDATYARKQSLWYDITILLKTPIVMINGKGAV